MTLNKIIQSLINEVVQIEVSGKKQINGTLIDLGSDIVVLFNGADFMYIPLHHIQSLDIGSNEEYEIQPPTGSPSIFSGESDDELSYNEVLLQAKGKYVEIYITDDQSLHGYITHIKNDYFEFYSPIYKKMYIAINHLKWLIPYVNNENPYGQIKGEGTFQTDTDSLENTFEAQVEKLKSSIVVLNIGGKHSHIGKINNVEKQIIEMKTARIVPIYLNLDHIKTLHQV